MKKNGYLIVGACLAAGVLGASGSAIALSSGSSRPTRNGETSERVRLNESRGSIKARVEFRRRARDKRLCGSLTAEWNQGDGISQYEDPDRQCISRRTIDDLALMSFACPGGVAISFASPDSKTRPWLRTADGQIRRLPSRPAIVQGRRTRLNIAAIPVDRLPATVSWTATGKPQLTFPPVSDVC